MYITAIQYIGIAEKFVHKVSWNRCKYTKDMSFRNTIPYIFSLIIYYGIAIIICNRVTHICPFVLFLHDITESITTKYVIM